MAVISSRISQSGQQFLDPADSVTPRSLLAGATLWLDATGSVDAEQTMVNRGTGGSALNATYGSLGTADTNDPLFLGHTGTNYLYLPGVAGNYASTPDAAALDITGDIEIVCRVSLDDWTPAAINALASKRGGAGQFSWALTVLTTGQLQLVITTDGTTQVASNSVVPPSPFTDGTAYWLKVTRTSATGVCTWQWAADAATEPTSWTTIAANLNGAAGAIFASTAVVEVGASSAGGTMLTGKFYRTIVRNGIGGTTVFDADFTTKITSGAQATFTEASSNAATVTINRGTAGRKAVAVVRPVLLFGTDDYLEVADNALLNFAAADSFTAMVVVRQWATPVNFGIFLDKSTTNNDGWTLQGKTDFKLWAQVEDSGAVAAATLSSLDAGTTAGALAMRYMRLNRSGNTLEAGVNSTTPASTSAAAVGTLVNAQPLRVGRLAVGSNYQDFEMVAVAVWRRALTAGEIASIVNYYGAG